MPGARTWSGTRLCVPARCKQPEDTYWNRRAKQQTPRSISWKREEKGCIWWRGGSGSAAWHGRLPRRAGGPQPPLPSPTTHLPGSSIQRLPLLSTTSPGGRGCPAPTSTGRKVGVLEDTGGRGQQAHPGVRSRRHATSRAEVLGEGRHCCGARASAQEKDPIEKGGSLGLGNGDAKGAKCPSPEGPGARWGHRPPSPRPAAGAY